MTTAPSRAIDFYSRNRYMSPPQSDQYKWLLRDSKLPKDNCLSVECIILSLSVFFFQGFLCAVYLKWSLFYLSNLSITSSLFVYHVLTHSVINLTLYIAPSTHLVTLLVIYLVFIMIKPVNLAAATFSIYSSTFW